MKRQIVLILVLAMIGTACGVKDKKKTPVATATPTPVATATASGVTAESELVKKSREFTEQIVAGLFTPVWECFAVELANQMPEEQLKLSWNSVINGISGYEGIHRIEESENEGNSIVLVTIRYKNNEGRSIRYVYNEEGNIVGIWFQEEEIIAKTETENRPGAWEEKKITIGRDPYTLEGKLTLPSGKEEKPPVVILLSDRADSDMDGTIGAAENKPLRDLAQGLAEKNIATLRYHRRAYQYGTEVSEEDSVYETLLQDVWYAIDQMYNQEEIDTGRIYILAYGKAADYLPAIVEQKSSRLSGAIMIGAKPLYAVEAYYGEEKTQVISDAKYFMDKNSTIPLLVLRGEEDFETPMKHFEQWKEIWKGRSHVTYHSHQKLNHYLMEYKGYETSQEYDVENRVSGRVIEEIAEWCGK